MYKIVLLRHGESTWNKENRFTGWTDVELSEQGIAEARTAGKQMQEAGFAFDIAFSSLLKRAIHTLQLSLTEMDRLWVPIQYSWRLNERHYGNLQGLNKSETAEKFGEEQTLQWRRSYDIPPPPLLLEDPRHPRFDVRYANLVESALPTTECLKDTVKRFIPFWEDSIAPAIKSGKAGLVVAHGNSIRAFVKHLDNISEQDIISLNIPTGIPLVYELDEHLKPIRHYYLGDAKAAAEAAERVAKQASSST